MLVFLLGLLFHLMIPIQLVTSSTLKIEKIYNSHRLRVEQSLMKTIAGMNSFILSNKLQVQGHSVRSMFKTFSIKNRY